MQLRFCTVTDDGTRCAIEYNCVGWVKDEIPPQAGIAVYERGTIGRLAAARIYDDATPPAVSDSTEGWIARESRAPRTRVWRPDTRKGSARSRSALPLLVHLGSDAEVGWIPSDACVPGKASLRRVIDVSRKRASHGPTRSGHGWIPWSADHPLARLSQSSEMTVGVLEVESD
jgi:hypothetical protein